MYVYMHMCKNSQATSPILSQIFLRLKIATAVKIGILEKEIHQYNIKTLLYIYPFCSIL